MGNGKQYQKIKGCGNMKYMTSMQAAKKWDLTKRRVNSLCQEGAIPGAVQDGYRWMIPEDAAYLSGR